MKRDLAALIRPEIRALSPYQTHDATGRIKLDAMENPYRWPEALTTAWLERLRGVAVNRYPDPNAVALKQRLRERLALPDGVGLLFGNGSDELIQIVLTAVARPGSVVLAPTPTFSMYRLIAIASGMRYVETPLRGGAGRAEERERDGEPFALDRSALLAALAEQRPAALFLARPNNPTGNLFDRATVEAAIDAAPGFVVVDEAYIPFVDAGESLLDRVGQRENLLLLRTFSKVGLAGLRLGVLIGPEASIAEFDKVRMPYNINALTQSSVEFILDHMEVLEGQAQRICVDRERLAQRLATLPGVVVYPSRANFLLFRVAAGTAAAVFAGLRARGVLIKSFADGDPALRDCLRVTVGAPDENARFVEALRAAL